MSQKHTYKIHSPHIDCEKIKDANSVDCLKYQILIGKKLNEIKIHLCCQH